MTDKPEEIELLANRKFDLRLKKGAITSFQFARDSYETQYLSRGKRFGDVQVVYREEFAEEWKRTDTAALALEGAVKVVKQSVAKVSAYFKAGEAGMPDIGVELSYELDHDSLRYTVHLRNESERTIEIGDLSIPFPMNSDYEWGTKPHESVLRHGYVSGHNSFLFWLRCNSAGPYLLMTTAEQTKLEYFDLQPENEEKPGGKRFFRAYVHSAAEGQVGSSKGTRWRQPHTSVKLAPRGQSGDTAVYSFKFQWADSYEDVRSKLVDEGHIDVQVIPGMTVPSDLHAMFYLRSNVPIQSVTPEFPEHTELTYVKQESNIQVYRVKFDRLGENLLTVKYGDGKVTRLEFFSTEPVETLIRKRGAFIAKHQYCDPGKWYNGLLAEWNMESEVMLSPDNYDRIKGWRIYAVTCDDPGLSKPAFLSAKNAEYPVEAEVVALDDYIENFVWGGLQQTVTEEYPYGIYGIPDWKVLRDSEDAGPKGRTHIWRIYDYPHIALMYWSMYRIAKNYPDIPTKLAKEIYLERAYRTAVAMFTIPLETGDWSAYKTGLYNELIYEDLIEELKAAGYPERAHRLENHWKKKVKHFVKENADLFGSEYPFDSTGFESTHALAKYAMKHAADSIAEVPDKRAEEVISRTDAAKFMEAQIEANVFCRGWISPAYYLYGSDYRGESNAAYTLSYMSQMGGWALLDYALNYSPEPHDYLRLGYASILSSWALMNTGTPQSGYGFWYPGEANDGGAGGGFEPSPYGQTWLDQDHHRGSWYYSCEIDLGYCGALRGASTILAEDPVFGLFCYGGDYDRSSGGFSITMKDGVRRRLHVLLETFKLALRIDTDHISAKTPVFVKEDGSEIEFRLDSISETEHSARLTVSGLPEGNYGIFAEETKVGTLKGGVESEVSLSVQLQGMTVRIGKE